MSDLRLLAPVAEPEEPLTPRPRRRALRWMAAFVALAMLLTAAATAVRLVLYGAPAPDARWVSAGHVEALRDAGVVWVPRAEAFVVKVPGGFIGLYALSPHVGERLRYCPSSGWFWSPAHGEMFDRDGTYADGPSPRGMDRVELRLTEDDVVQVRRSPVIEGAPRGVGALDRPKGPFCDSSGSTV